MSMIFARPRLAIKPALRSKLSLRWFSQSRFINHPYACTWLSKTPEQITPDDVLSSLPPIPQSLTEPGNVPVLLVTPSFAPWIDPASGFLEQWITRLFQNTLPGSRHAIAAIIDQLPDPRGHEAIGGDDIPESEGLSLLLVREENIQGQVSQPRRLKSLGSEESALIYSVQMSNDSVRKPIHEVGLRLANTIFVNGNDNTLSGIRWTLDSSNRWNLDQSLDLSKCVITSSATSVQDTLNLPLDPVGQRRKVITSMGNILRQISKSPEGNDPMPASLELEKVLPRYIAENNIVDQRVSVWALVETSDANATTETDTQVHLDKSLRTGGKLHRVMSGGGGWGKKQGLLSLDPEISFLGTDREKLSVLDDLFNPHTDSADSMPDLPPLDGMLVDDLSLLSQVAKAGDYIQFFVSVEPSAGPSKLPSQEGMTCQFGVVSDAELSEEQPIDNIPKDLVMLPNFFGALSEKAITYLQPLAESEGEILESGTKLDMPGSRVNLTLS